MTFDIHYDAARKLHIATSDGLEIAAAYLAEDAAYEAAETLDRLAQADAMTAVLDAIDREAERVGA